MGERVGKLSEGMGLVLGYFRWPSMGLLVWWRSGSGETVYSAECCSGVEQ